MTNHRVPLTCLPMALCLVVFLLGTLGCSAPDADVTSDTEGAEAAAPGLDHLPDGADQAAATIDEAFLKQQIAAIADDSMAGRAPGTEGGAKARRYIASELEKLGLEPAGTDGWDQPFDVVSVDARVPKSWSFEGSGGELDLALNSEFIAFSGVQEEHAAIDNSELVFVGYGIEAPEYDWNDFKDADLTGKTLVIMNNDPDWDPELFEGDRRLYYGRWTYKYEVAAEKGAAAAIVIHTQPSAGYPWQVVETSWTGPQIELPAGDEPRIAIGAWTTEDATRRLFELGGHDLDTLRESAKSRDFEPVPLGVTTSLSLDVTLESTSTANVLGLLPGGDPELADQVVIYSAHFDHLGTAPDGEGDTIYNGALDNASGVAQLLAIARAFESLPEPPRRSILFAFVGAEESGLLGSAHYAADPTYPAGKIAANLNYDGANIWGRARDLTFIGYGKSSLDRIVEAAAAMQDRVVKGDQFPDRGFFYRSDQFNFAKIGVPAIYLDTGTDFRDRPAEWGREQIEAWESEHYHQVSDELVDTWNFDGMIEDAQLGLYCGLEIANEDEMPSWKPGDEFEAARLDALAAVAP